MTRKEQILKAAEFDVEFNRNYSHKLFGPARDTIGESYVLQATRNENSRLMPLITALAERVEMLEKVCKLVLNWNSTNQELEPKEVLFMYNNMVLKAQQALSASTAINELLKEIKGE